MLIETNFQSNQNAIPKTETGECFCPQVFEGFETLQVLLVEPPSGVNVTNGQANITISEGK